MSSLPPAWLADPVGRHDLRFWSGSTWTEHVADSGLPGIDPIQPPAAGPVTIRPSWAAYRSRLRAEPARRWLVTALFLPFALFGFLLAFYFIGGWVGVIFMGAFGIACLVVLPILHFRLTSITADSRGITITNQLGIRRFVPRDRIGAVAVGRAWSGGLRSANYAFVVSPAADQLGKWFLDLWDPADFRRLANALELELYGRSDRQLDEFHTGKNTERTARFLAGSAVAGTILGFAIPVALGLILFFVFVAGHR